MKRRTLLIFVLTLTIALGVVGPASNRFRAFSTTAQSDSAAPASYPHAEDDLPMTDRVPWLIYVVLTSAILALALILFNLARQQKNARANDKHET